MFKKKLISSLRIASVGRCGLLATACVLVIFLAGCAGIPRLPPVNLSETGWATRHGQAVWRYDRHATEIAGDLTLATNFDGRMFVGFSKNPVSLVIAQTTADSWQFEFVPREKIYSGKNPPPARLPWLLLPDCLRGNPPPKPWTWQPLPDNHWRLENSRTGESLEGYLDP
jgi:hypothetical protein